MGVVMLVPHAVAVQLGGRAGSGARGVGPRRVVARHRVVVVAVVGGRRQGARGGGGLQVRGYKEGNYEI